MHEGTPSSNSFRPFEFIVYQSGLNQRSRSRTCVLWDLLQGIGLLDCGDWLGRSHIHRAGCQKGSCQAAVHRGNFFFFGKASAVLLRSFNWMNHWDHLKKSSLFKNPPLMNINYIYKVPSQKHLYCGGWGGSESIHCSVVSNSLQPQGL